MPGNCGPIIDNISVKIWDPSAVILTPSGNIVKNGDFESTSCGTNAQCQYQSPSNAGLPNWQIGIDSNVDLLSSVAAASGSFSVDMSGSTPSALTQTLPLLPINKLFTLNFWVSRNTACDTNPRTLGYFVTDNAAGSVTHSGSSGYTPVTMQITGTGKPQVLSFYEVATAVTSCGVIIDFVSLVANDQYVTPAVTAGANIIKNPSFDTNACTSTSSCILNSKDLPNWIIGPPKVELVNQNARGSLDGAWSIDLNGDSNYGTITQILPSLVSFTTKLGK